MMEKNMSHLDYEQLHRRLLELSEEFSLYAEQNSEGYMGMIADKLKALAKEIAMKRS
jgi:hypothetical protein